MGGVISNPGEKMTDLIMMLKTAAAAVGLDRPPVNRITFPMIRQSGKSPKLRIKAAESRHMLPCIVYIMQHYFKMDSPHKQLRYNCIKAISDMYTHMRRSAEEFDGSEVARLGRKHLLLYVELGKETLGNLAHQGNGWVSWRWYPKHHLFSHCVEDQVRTSGSPAENWCCQDESAIGECVAVAENCHAATLHRLVIEKHRID